MFRYGIIPFHVEPVYQDNLDFFLIVLFFYAFKIFLTGQSDPYHLFSKGMMNIWIFNF